MKNIAKRIVTVIIAFCLVLTVPLAACKPKKENTGFKDGYYFTLCYPDGKTVNGETDSGNTLTKVCIVLYSGDTAVTDEASGKKFITVGTDGKAFYKCASGEYRVEVVNPPKGYALTGATTTKTAGEVKLTLVNSAIQYSATVSYPDGGKASGVNVKLLNGETVIASATTGADGVAKFAKTDAGVYKVEVEAPSGYICKGAQTKPDKADIAIQLLTLNLITFNNPMTEEEINKTALEINGEYALITIFDPERESYKFHADVEDGKEIFYSFTPAASGYYSMFIGDKKSKNHDIRFLGTDIDSADYQQITLNSGTGREDLSLQKDETYFISCSTTDGKNGSYDFILSMPDFHLKTDAIKVGTNEIEMFADSQLLSFSPTEPGVYTVSTSESELDTELVALAVTNNPLVDDDGNVIGDDDSGEGKNFSFEETAQGELIYESNSSEPQWLVRQTYNYKIIIRNLDGSKATGFPKTVTVRVEKTGEVERPKPIPVTTVTATATEKYTETGSFIQLGVDKAVTPTLGKDGYYYVDINGTPKKLLVAITKNIRTLTYSFATIEYMGESGDTPMSEKQNNYLTVYEDIETQDARLNYTVFIEAYATLCNGDGVYPVNEELKSFLEHYFAYKITSEGKPLMTQQYGNVINTLNLYVAPGNEWLVACGFYK